MSAITVDRLTKDFGSVRAVDNLSFEVPAGGVIGLVGPNGSGKSTTIRMLLGLIEPTAGTGTVLGHPIDRPARYTHRVGALIEAPAFYPGLSARENLRTIALLGGHPDRRIDEVLEITGIADRANDRVSNYSLGMKQRLGIATALLPDPDLLILDEPTNGLDPAGIVEIRSLLVSLGAAGKTVFVSSHLMAEIQAACDRLVVIQRGRLLFAGPVDDLLARGGAGLAARAEFEGDHARLCALLNEAGYYSSIDGPQLLIRASRDAAPALNRLAMNAGITLRELREQESNLEQVFLEVTRPVEEVVA